MNTGARWTICRDHRGCPMKKGQEGAREGAETVEGDPIDPGGPGPVLPSSTATSWECVRAGATLGFADAPGLAQVFSTDYSHDLDLNGQTKKKTGSCQSVGLTEKGISWGRSPSRLHKPGRFSPVGNPAGGLASRPGDVRWPCQSLHSD